MSSLEITDGEAPLTTERTATMTTYRYSVGELKQYAHAACDDIHYLGRVEIYDHLRGVDLNWDNADRKQFYGIAKSCMERLLIDLVDDLDELDVTLEVKVKPKTRAIANLIVTEWKEAIDRFHYRYGEQIASEENQSATDEPKGGANED